jgi:hypothetical protein
VPEKQKADKRGAPENSEETEKPTVTLPGTVQKIITSPHPEIPEKVEIAIEGADELYKEIRIENTLTDQKGNEVQLTQGAEVDVTVEADPKDTTAKAKEKVTGKS